MRRNNEGLYCNTKRKGKFTHTWFRGTLSKQSVIAQGGNEMCNDISWKPVIKVKNAKLHSRLSSGGGIWFSSLSVTWWNGFCAATFFPQPIKASGRDPLYRFLLFSAFDVFITLCSHDKERTTILLWQSGRFTCRLNFVLNKHATFKFGKEIKFEWFSFMKSIFRWWLLKVKC